jgi:hypothetical protein
MHAIAVPEGVTLLEFDGTSYEAPEVQQSEPTVRCSSQSRSQEKWWLSARITSCATLLKASPGAL